MRQRKQLTAAFTIIELLVATAVTAVLAGLMIAMTSGILTAWNRTSGTLSANNQAKLILDQISQDLQSAIFRYDPANPQAVGLAVDIVDPINKPIFSPVTLASQRGWETSTAPQTVVTKPTAAQEPRSFDLEATDLADTRYGFGGVWLRFFTNSFDAVDNRTTVPAAVGYQIIRRHVTSSTTTPNPAEIRYMLYRTEVKDTNTLLDPNLSDTYDLGSVDPNHYVHDQLTDPANSDILATNVIDFGVRLYVRVPGALDPIFPVDGAYEFDDDHTEYLADGSPLTPGTVRGPFPDVADVMVRILTEEGARQIQNLEANRLFQDLSTAEKHERWWDIAETHSQVFTRRVYLTARSF